MATRTPRHSHTHIRMFADIRTGLAAVNKRNRYKDFCTTHPEFGLPAEVRANFAGGWRVAVD